MQNAVSTTGQLTSTHERLTECWFNAGPASATLAQQKTSIWSACRVCKERNQNLTSFISQQTRDADPVWANNKTTLGQCSFAEIIFEA